MTPEILWSRTVHYVTGLLGRDVPSEQIQAVTVKVYEQMEFLLKESPVRR